MGVGISKADKSLKGSFPPATFASACFQSVWKAMAFPQRGLFSTAIFDSLSGSSSGMAWKIGKIRLFRFPRPDDQEGAVHPMQ